MAQDLLEICLTNETFAEEVMDNPEVANSFAAIVDRMILIYGKDIKQMKLTGPYIPEGFDVAWKLGVK